jgi:hypothetical protein
MGSMVDTIDLCEDDVVSCNQSFSPGTQRRPNTQPSERIAVQLSLPSQSETAALQPKVSPATMPDPGPQTLHPQSYPEAFYIDFIATIEHSFPWQAFAMRRRISENDIRHLFFVLVTLPLSDPDDNSKRLKVAQGARKRFNEWRQAWEETVVNTKVGRSGNENYKGEVRFFDSES